MAKRVVLLNTIAKGEGTSDAAAKAHGYSSGYDVPLKYGKFGQPPKPISTMTLAELDSYQEVILSNTDNKFPVGDGTTQPSSAMGRYQITKKTLGDLKSELNLSDNEKFTPELQDRLANHLIEQRTNIEAYEQGQDVDIGQIQNQLSGTWASIPKTSGGSTYGQPVGVRGAEIQAAIRGDAIGSGLEPIKTQATSGTEEVDAEGNPVPQKSNASILEVGPQAPLTDEQRIKSDEDVEYSYDANGNPIATLSTGEVIDVFEVPFEPTPNRFKQFNTMTYSVSLYIIDSPEYLEMVRTGKKSVKGLTLFMQSGGTNQNIGLDEDANFGAKRSPHFSDDFYLNNIQFKSLISGTATGAAHNTYEINFSVEEPAGMTFFDRLYALVDDYQHEVAKKRKIDFKKGQRNYIAQNYLAVIRFYGYDEHGNQIDGSSLESKDKFTDPKAVGEKFIPFMFTGITYTLNTEQVVYSCSGVCTNSLVSQDVVHAKVPFNVQLQGSTVRQLLEGTPGTAEMTTREFTEAEKKNAAKGYDTSAGKVSAFANLGGFMDILNQHQLTLFKRGKYDVPDRYSIKFEDNVGLDDATVEPTSTVFMPRSGFNPNEPKNKISDKIKVDKEKKIFSFQSGTSISQILDLILRSSSYISNQYEQTTDQNTEKTIVTGKQPKAIYWFKITTEAIPGDWDAQRNDYAYHITFYINRYRINSIDSPYFSKIDNSCFSIHKQFNFWFTGENTEVLDFEQKYDYLWYSTFGANFDNSKSLQNNLNGIRRRFFSTNSADTAVTDEGRANESAANIAADLYSPGDQANARIEIVGDPDFICQSELFYGPAYRFNSPNKHHPFLPDGSINPDVSEIFFVINYNTVVDYDLKTGLADVTAENVARDPSTGEPGLARHSFVYRANEITTQLENGKFTQILEGSMVFVPATCTFGTGIEKVERREDSMYISSTSNIAKAGDNDAVRGPIDSVSDVTWNKPTIDLTKVSGVDQSEDVVVNNGIATDTPQTVTNTSTKNTTPPAEKDSYYDKAVDVVEDKLNSIGRFTRGVFSSVSEVGEDLRDAFDDSDKTA